MDTERPRDVTNLGLVFGRAEEGQAWVGRILPERTAVCEVTTSMVIDFCALVEDPNPAYWGGGEAPPGLLMTWTFPPPWQPHTAPGPALAAAAVPLPGRHVINVRTATSFVRQLRLGDRVSWTDEILEVTPPKRTRLGTGHFITTRTSFTDAAGNPVAVNDNVLYRYDVAETQPTLAGAAPASVPEAIPASPELPPVVIDIPYRRVVLNAAATWDWFPGHHDPEYARGQGQRTIYLSTIFFHGLVDRAATTWSGPGFRISKREIRMQRSIYAGQNATVHGRVLPETGDGSLCFDGIVASPEGPCVPFSVTAVRR